MSDRRKEFDPSASDSAANARPAAGADGPRSARPDMPPAMSPGDQAPAGTPGTGEDVCPVCGGSGRNSNAGMTCPNCEGTGKVIVGIGGA